MTEKEKEKKKANHWRRQIDRLLDNDVRFALKNRRESAKETLEGIRDFIDQNERITNRQINLST